MAEMVMAKVLALSGSARKGSYSRAALDVAVAAARKLGATVDLYDLGENKLPPFDGSEQVEKEHPAVLDLKRRAKEADALLLATPVYHDSYSGVLKNTLDLLYYEEVSDKLAGLIAVGGGRIGHGQALEHLRAVLREMGAWVLPRQVLVGSSSDCFGEDGQLKDPELLSRLGLLGQELVLRSKLFRTRRRAP